MRVAEGHCITSPARLETTFFFEFTGLPDDAGTEKDFH